MNEKEVMDSVKNGKTMSVSKANGDGSCELVVTWRPGCFFLSFFYYGLGNWGLIPLERKRVYEYEMGRACSVAPLSAGKLMKWWDA